MKRYVLIGLMALLSASCLREHYNEEDCRGTVQFDMKDVPYIFQGSEVVSYLPYYNFIENLSLFEFVGERLQNTTAYGFAYCREHQLIPYDAGTGNHFFLFAANLYDPKELDWTFTDGRLQAVFLILDNEEPPVLLTAVNEADAVPGTVIPVQLHMLVSRLEIRVDNPPSWVNGLDVSLSNVAGSITSGFVLGDTTHIFKHLPLENQGAGTYWSGLNTFPTYPDSPALLNINLTGTAQASIRVDDDRLHLVPGSVTRVEILFEAENQLKISIEVDGKWEVVDGGNIII